MLKTPILIITFNRPNHTRQVWEEIKKQKPKQVFVFQDGARVKNETDIKKCADVRAIFEEKLDWECDLQTFYSETNLGCGKGPASAITWFFECVEEGIILEDDCFPTNDFFPFVEDLLDRYKDNDKISFIGGSSFQNGIQRGDGSYYFSAGPYGTWGWATWKSTWEKFDYMLDGFDEKMMKILVKTYFKKQIQRNYWMEIFHLTKDNRCNESCWDYQFYFSCWKNNMLAVIPNSNLITNIGFDSEGTHTFDENHPASNAKTESILPIKIPSKVVIDKNADFYLHKTIVQPYEFGWSGIKRLPFRVNKRIKRLFNIKGSWFK